MHTQNTPILDTIEPEIVDTLVSRREAIQKGARISAGTAAALAIGSAPIAIAALARDAYGQSAQLPANVVNVLQFALLLENLESEFYKAVLGTSASAAYNALFAPVRAQVLALPNSGSVLASLQLIAQHEAQHVAFLRGVLGSAAATYTPTSFDFTGGQGSGTGPFAPAASNLQFLLALTQGVEDTGVRAYKGQAPALLRQGPVLQAALQIHAVEARHAARIRRLRRATGSPDTVRYSGTIVGGGAAAAGVGSNITGVPAASLAAATAAFELIYQNEQNTAHVVNNGSADATVNAASLANLPSGANPTLAFDEPLTTAQVVAIVRPFIAASTPIPTLPT